MGRKFYKGTTKAQAQQIEEGGFFRVEKFITVPVLLFTGGNSIKASSWVHKGKTTRHKLSLLDSVP
jgi:hypothetical protein